MMQAVDSHVHIWTKDTETYPTHTSHPLPTSLASTGDDKALLAAMDRALVTTALVVQPINYMYDHNYITSCASANPSRLRPVALARVSNPPEAASAALRTDVTDGGCIGVRVNPGLAAGGLTDPSVNAVMRTAAELHVPVSLFVMGMLGVEGLIAAHPSTQVVIDHFAFCTPGDRDAQFKQLLQLGRSYENANVKTSAFFRVSKLPYPYKDLHSSVLSLVDAFSANRVLFGSDFPFVTELCSYKEAWDVLDHIPLSTEDRAMVRGGAARRLYKLSQV